MSAPVLPVAQFNELPADDARALLRPVLDSAAWLTAMVNTRPYGSLDAVLDRSDAAARALDALEVASALRSHPRIGERAAGPEQEAAWSREEQAGAAGLAPDVEQALHRGNVEYEQRFGQVFLVCAAGRGPAEILADLNERLDNDPDTEQDVVRRELAAIAKLRLQRVLA